MVADLEHVREVTIAGSADLEYWTGRLAPLSLKPLSSDGSASLIISAAEGRFGGIRFREISFSLMLEAEPSDLRSALLLHAFNSRWIFALPERLLFDTPYEFAAVEVVASKPVATTLRLFGGGEFSARMGSTRSGTTAPGGWTGKITLPPLRDTRVNRWFLAIISGETETVPFDPADTLLMCPGRRGDVISELIASGFCPLEWTIRTDARHAKSATQRVPRTNTTDSAVGSFATATPDDSQPGHTAEAVTASTRVVVTEEDAEVARENLLPFSR